MKKYLPLILGLIAVFTVAYSFVNEAYNTTFLFFDVNIWVYRGIWAFIGAYMLYKFFTTQRHINHP